MQPIVNILIAFTALSTSTGVLISLPICIVPAQSVHYTICNVAHCVVSRVNPDVFNTSTIHDI